MKLPPFQALLDEHRTDLYRFCVATAGRGEADDCFQETWIAALRAYPKLRSTREPARLAVPDRPEQGDRPAPFARTPAGAGRGRARARPPPSRRPRRRSTASSELWAALRGLPPKQRTAVFCRTVLGMPYAELAELLESSEDAARRNVFEGLKRLREEWTA